MYELFLFLKLIKNQIQCILHLLNMTLGFPSQIGKQKTVRSIVVQKYLASMRFFTKFGNFKIKWTETLIFFDLLTTNDF